MGAVSCMLKRKAIDANTQLIGASAGALVTAAVCAKGEGCIDECMGLVSNMAAVTRGKLLSSLTPRFSLVDEIEPRLWAILKECDPAAFNSRLHIVLCDTKAERHVKSEFESAEHVLAAAVLSSYIPFGTGPLLPGFQQPATAVGRASSLVGNYVDGGLIDQFPVLDDHTVSVAPFIGRFGREYICPPSSSPAARHVTLDGRVFIEVSLRNLKAGKDAALAPTQEGIDQAFADGYDHTEAWLASKGRSP